MSITCESEWIGMRRAATAVAGFLKEMRAYARPGMTTLELNLFARKCFKWGGARSASILTYGFPGWPCISVNKEIAHRVRSDKRALQIDDLVNIDLSAELDGYWADKGGSFVLGKRENVKVAERKRSVKTSRRIQRQAISRIRGGLRIAELGRLIECEAWKSGYRVIRNRAGNGVGRSLHEEPNDVDNFYDRYNTERFKKHAVVAVEPFIATRSTLACTLDDGRTLVGNRGGLVAQHKHTIVVTDQEPIILAAGNRI